MSRPFHDHSAAHNARRLRRTMTISEARLWAHIRKGALGARFRRQVPVGSWIVDFASFGPRLIIEVDGERHRWIDEVERTAYLESLGFTILRFENRDVALDLEAVLGTIRSTIEIQRARGSRGA